VLDGAAIKAFAADWDPQAIHLDEAAAAIGPFGGLVASGWHTLALTMRLFVEARLFGDHQAVGVEVRRARFLAPVRPGAELAAIVTVTAVTRSRSKPDRAFVDLTVATVDADGATVVDQEWTVMVPAAAVG
jgi:acyl dehydratase